MFHFREGWKRSNPLPSSKLKAFIFFSAYNGDQVLRNWFTLIKMHMIWGRTRILIYSFIVRNIAMTKIGNSHIGHDQPPFSLAKHGIPGHIQKVLY